MTSVSRAVPSGPAQQGRLVLVVRHGQTAYNRQGLFRGRLDVGLDEAGREQARLTAAFLSSSKALGPLAAICSSPLRRARETSRPLAAATGLDVTVDEALDDVDVGRWEGRSASDVEASDPALYRSWLEDPAAFAFPGGESLAAVEKRVFGFLSKLPARCPRGTAVLFTHRVPAKLIIAGAAGAGAAGFWRLRIDNCSISAVEIGLDGRQVVTLVNSTAHLPSGDQESGWSARKPDF